MYLFSRINTNKMNLSLLSTTVMLVRHVLWTRNRYFLNYQIFFAFSEDIFNRFFYCNTDSLDRNVLYFTVISSNSKLYYLRVRKIWEGPTRNNGYFPKLRLIFLKLTDLFFDLIEIYQSLNKIIYSVKAWVISFP